MTLARILKPYRDAQGRWHVPAEIDLPYDASVHLIVSAPEHAISAALQMAAGRVSNAITGGGNAHAALPPIPNFGGIVAGYHDTDGDYVGYDEVAGWWSNLGNKIGKALSSGIGKKIVKGVVSYIPYVGPAIAQSGLVDMALDAGGKAARKSERKARNKRGRPRRGGRPTTRRAARRRPARPRRRMTREERRAAAIRRIKDSGGLNFGNLRRSTRGGSSRKRGSMDRTPRRAARAGNAAKVQQFRDLLQLEHGATGASHVLRLAKAVKLLERASHGDRKAMGMIDRTTHQAAAGDPRAQMAAGYIGALVRSSGDPLASILRDLGSRRAGYRPALQSHGM